MIGLDIEVDWRRLTGLAGWKLYLTVLGLAHIQVGLGSAHLYPPTHERADTRQWQSLRSLYIRIDIGKAGCERVRFRTRTRFFNCILL